MNTSRDIAVTITQPQTLGGAHYVTSHPGQLILAIPSWVGAMSTGDGYGHR